MAMRKLLFFMLGVVVVSTSQSSVITPDAIVSKSRAPGAGVYNTVNDAVEAAPRLSPNKYYIYIEAGDKAYEERVVVPKDKTNIVLYGDEANKALIKNSLSAGGNIGTDETATLTVDGEGFIAMYLQIENSAGDGQDMQAVAAMTRADHVVYYKCIFWGNQDTLYADTGTQLYKNCDIYGTVDFVFGSAAAVFQTCNFYARVPETITFIAHKKVNPNDFSGFVIQDSKLTKAPWITDTSKFNAYLGRPWSDHSTVVVMESAIDGIIKPAGWMPWDPPSDNRTDFVTILEYNNGGRGAYREGRVNWSKNITDGAMVEGFTVDKFINRGDWLKAAIEGTDISYFGGFKSTST